jgi:hypothetical protein
MQSGRPRKPLAEVILRSAPLRATSSGLCISIWRAVHKPFKTQVVETFDSVGIAHSEKELLRLPATREDASALQPLAPNWRTLFSAMRNFRYNRDGVFPSA